MGCMLFTGRRAYKWVVGDGGGGGLQAGYILH